MELLIVVIGPRKTHLTQKINKDCFVFRRVIGYAMKLMMRHVC